VHGAVAKITEAHQNYRELTALKEASKLSEHPFSEAKSLLGHA
jgi:hypothetical protein